ncbi:MAG: hypothetical protein CSA74_08335 [Rhodobacterales bacterium]|nr:MAG: hypothetical protein CSA74_08335 [Rhodobacterales bacterium]
MSEVVTCETREGVALITVANPPVNALVQPVRAGIDACLTLALEDESVGAIVIGAEGRTFPAGTDVRDFQREADRPRLGEVCARIEASPKPVIAAIHGTAVGGGLELALACHYRLAASGTQFGAPDVMLGVVPTAGGTQRLPRLVGPARALEMLLSGRPVKAKQAERAGLIDKMIRKNVGQAAFGAARNMAKAGQKPRPTRDWTGGFTAPDAYLAIVAARRSALEGPLRAPAKVVDLVEAALLLPFEVGLSMERAAYEDLVHGDQARGLRHAFLAERRSARPPRAAARALDHVVILGQGAEAAWASRACLEAGLPVLLAEPDAPARLALRTRIVADYAADVQAGRLAADDRDRALERLDTGGESVHPAPGGLMLATGEAAAATESLTRAASTAPPGTVLALGAVGADPGAVARATERTGDVLGLVLPPPAHRTGLVELSLPEGAPADLAATGCAFARATDRIPVRLEGAVAGQLCGRLEGALFAAAEVLALTGTPPAAVDGALREAGFAHGPFERADRGWLRPLDAPGGESRLRARMAGAGWSGRAAGQGFYGWGPDGTCHGTPPEVLRLIGALREASRIPAAVTPPAPGEILRRCLIAMANAGARLLSEGVVKRPSDVDVAAIHGLGLPRWLGGPMAMADGLGLLHVRNLMRAWAGSGDLSLALWTPDPLFGELLRTGRDFGDLNG